MTGAVKWLLAALAIAALAVFPFLVTNSYYLHLAVFIGIFAIVTLGLDIVFGYTGEVSVGHAALVGVGAYTAGVLSLHLGLGMAVAIPCGIVVAAAFGAVLALPALRVTGPYLAMVTLAFGTVVQILINEMTFLTNGAQGLALVKPMIADLRGWGDTLPFLQMPKNRMRETGFYFVVALALVLTVVVINRLLASRFGRAFEALRDSPIASDCMGVSVYRHKVLAFVLSACFAGLAGVLFAYSEQYIAPNNFGFELSILYLLAVTLGGRRSRTGPILGAAIVVYLPNLLADLHLFRITAGAIAAVAVVAGGVLTVRKPEERVRIAIPVALCIGFFAFALLLQNITDYKLSIFGLMILFVVFYLPDGIFGFVRRAIPFLRPGYFRRPVEAAAADAIGPPAAATDGALLVVRGIAMHFGGLRALDGVDLSVARGTIHGLIGPNGSGKSTMMNLLTGIYVPTGGDIVFEGRGIGGHKPPDIAAAGIARTFQNVQLFGELSLLENVMVGLNHTYAAGIGDVVVSSGRARREEAAARARAIALLRFVGLDALAFEEARNLPYGKQRMLEIARALALDPKLLLLDEPAAGLTAPDITELMAIIRRVRDAGITLILIEHHMDVVMTLCDVVTVLDFGQKIAEGKPASVQQDPRVIAAYLGSHEPVAA